MIVLDTNVVSEVLRPTPDPAVVAWLESVTEPVALTTITVAELLAEVRRLPAGRRRDELNDLIESVLAPYEGNGCVLPFDVAAARSYAAVVTERSAAGQPIAMADAQIAAICRSRAAVCATRNVRDFTGTGVTVLNPWT